MSAFLNAIREEGTREELFEALAEIVAERDALRAVKTELFLALKEARPIVAKHISLVAHDCQCPGCLANRVTLTKIDAALRGAL